MLKQSLKIMLSMNLALLPFSIKTWALETIPKISDYSCLNRAQEDKINDCFSELQIARAGLEVKQSPGLKYWNAVTLGIVGGFLAGVVLAVELRK